MITLLTTPDEMQKALGRYAPLSKRYRWSVAWASAWVSALTNLEEAGLCRAACRGDPLYQTHPIPEGVFVGDPKLHVVLQPSGSSIR